MCECSFPAPADQAQTRPHPPPATRSRGLKKVPRRFMAKPSSPHTSHSPERKKTTTTELMIENQ